MVSIAIWKKHARVSFSKRLSKLHESEGQVQFEVFEKLTSVCFFKLHKKPYYYLYKTEQVRELFKKKG